jgi:hypothetical protein
LALKEASIVLPQSIRRLAAGEFEKQQILWLYISFVRKLSANFQRCGDSELP